MATVKVTCAEGEAATSLSVQVTWRGRVSRAIGAERPSFGTTSPTPASTVQPLMTFLRVVTQRCANSRREPSVSEGAWARILAGGQHAVWAEAPIASAEGRTNMPEGGGGNPMLGEIVGTIIWEGGARLLAAIGNAVRRPGELKRVVAAVNRRTDAGLTVEVLDAFLKRRDLIELLQGSPDDAVAAFERQAADLNAPVQHAAAALGAVLGAVAMSDLVLADRMFKAHTVRALDELQAGLGFVLGEVLQEVLALRSLLDQDTARAQMLEMSVTEAEAEAAQLFVAVGVADTVATELACDLGVGLHVDPVDGEVVVFTALAGSGKSLTAVRTHELGLVDAVASEEAPIPLKVHTREVVTGGLGEFLLRRAAGLGDPHAVGVRVVIDGLDESSRADAQRIVNEACVVVKSWRNSSVVAFGRPDLEYHGAVCQPLPDVTADDLDALVARITGREDGRLYGLAAPVRAAVRRPLYAVAVAVMQARGVEVPTSRVGIIRELVALHLDPAVADANTPVLMELAAQLIETGSMSEAGFGVAKAGQVSGSRLVIRDRGTLDFSVPIYKEWFAALALLEGSANVTLRPDDPSAFDRWRYALALAMEIGGSDAADRIARSVTENAPGGLPVLVSDATSAPQPMTELPAPAAEDRARVLTSLTVTFSAVADLLAVMGPDAPEPTETEVEVTPDAVGLEVWTCDSERSRRSRVRVRSPEAAWPWPIAVKVSSAWVHAAIERRSLTVAHPVYLQELAWAFARLVVGGSGLTHREIELDRVTEALETLRLPDDDPAYVRNGRGDILWLTQEAIPGVKAAVEELSGGGAMLRRPWPVPDVSETYHVDDLYSPLLAAGMLRDIYAGAIEIYEQMVERWFAQFGSFLATYAALPAMVRLTYSPRTDEVGGALLSERWFPEPHGQPSSVAVAIVERPPELFREELGNGKLWERAGRQPPPFSRTHSYSIGGFDGIHHDRPASSLALHWLSEDLKRLGWITKALGWNARDR
jgi:hypothetical protein